MNPHAWCTIGVRFLGLVLALLALPTLGLVLSRSIHAVTLGYGPSFFSPFVDHGDDDPFNAMGTLAQFALGLYLFLSGRWVIGKLTRGLAGTCPRCGYDITGTDSSRCPECGTKLPVRAPAKT